MEITRENAVVGKPIFWATDDRPFDVVTKGKGIITSVADDHFLYTDTDHNIPNIWGDYYSCSVATMETESDIEQWLKERG